LCPDRTEILPSLAAVCLKRIKKISDRRRRVPFTLPEIPSTGLIR
jgi:hypothetical protein